MKKRVALVVGEASGEAIAAAVLRVLRAYLPDLCIEGVGGKLLAAEGMQLLQSYELLAVHGFADALGRLPQLWRLRQSLTHRFQRTAQAFIGVDAPDFNLPLEIRLRRAGVATAHIVSPSVWAWRKRRVRTVARAAELLFCLFPFEPRYYEGLPLRVEYVGHPFADEIALEPERTAARMRLIEQTGQAEPLVALLPGSRHGECRRHLPLFLGAMELVARSFSRAVGVVAAANEFCAASAQALADKLSCRVVVLPPGSARLVLEAADVALIASGTATLEAALLKCPAVVAYLQPLWQFRLLKRLLRIPWVSLPNILAGRALLPEFLQEAASAAALAQALLAWLDHPQELARYREECSALHEMLRRNMAATTAAHLAEWLTAKRG